MLHVGSKWFHIRDDVREKIIIFTTYKLLFIYEKCSDDWAWCLIYDHRFPVSENKISSATHDLGFSCLLQTMGVGEDEWTVYICVFVVYACYVICCFCLYICVL